MSTIDNMRPYESAASTHAVPVAGDPAAPHISGNNGSLMSITNGNSVPMRGILPIEQMTDYDLYRFFPYTAYTDRIPKYTYYQLFNTGGK